MNRPILIVNVVCNERVCYERVLLCIGMLGTWSVLIVNRIYICQNNHEFEGKIVASLETFL